MRVYSHRVPTRITKLLACECCRCGHTWNARSGSQAYEMRKQADVGLRIGIVHDGCRMATKMRRATGIEITRFSTTRSANIENLCCADS